MKARAIAAYFDAEGSYRAVGRELEVKPHTVWGWVQELGQACRTFAEVATSLRPQWGGFLLADGRGVGIHGLPHALCLTADATSHDVPVARLTPGETGPAWRATFEALHATGYTPKTLILDDAPGLWAGADAVYPRVPRQLCVVHVMRSLRSWLRYKAHVPQVIAAPFVEACHGLCYALNAEHAVALTRRWALDRERFRAEGLAEATALFESKFPYLWTHFADPRIPRTTNILESIIRQLGRKLDDTDGFQSEETAWATIRLLILRYRFHKFSCRRTRGHNGQSPLNLAAVNTDGLDWVAFARRPASPS